MRRRNEPLITRPKWLCPALSWMHLPLRPTVMDLLVPIEMSFGAKLRREEFPWRAVEVDAADFTAGELHEWVCSQLRTLGKPVPFSSWHRIQRILAHLTGFEPRLVCRASYIQRDLRFFECR